MYAFVCQKTGDFVVRWYSPEASGYHENRYWILGNKLVLITRDGDEVSS